MGTEEIRPVEVRSNDLLGRSALALMRAEVDLSTALRAARKEARDNKKALRELSDTVLLFLHWMDNTVGPNKDIPRDLSTKLGKACTFLDMQNDGARRHRLGLSITAEGKKKDALALRGLLSA